MMSLLDQTGKRLSLDLISFCKTVTFLPMFCSHIQLFLTERSQCPEKTGHGHYTVRNITQSYSLSRSCDSMTHMTVTMLYEMPVILLTQVDIWVT